MLGDALDAEGRTREAIDAYRRAAALRGDQPMIWLKLGTLRMQSGDTRGAVEAFDRALALDARSATALNALGAVAMSEGRAEEARRRFDAALAADPAGVAARQLLAALDEQAGHWRRTRCGGARRSGRWRRATPDVEACIDEEQGEGRGGITPVTMRPRKPDASPAPAAGAASYWSYVVQAARMAMRAYREGRLTASPRRWLIDLRHLHGLMRGSG